MGRDDIKTIVELRNNLYKDTKIICSGGIDINNVKDYAILGVDGVVTSFLYSCGMADFGSKITII